MDLLSLLHVGVVLSDSFQSQLVHQVDGVGGAEVSVLYTEGGGSGKGGRGNETINKAGTRAYQGDTVHLALHLSPE